MWVSRVNGELLKCDRVSSLFVLDRLVSDNAMISVYPLGEELYAFAETPFIHSIDPVTMDTTGRVNFIESISRRNLVQVPVE